MATMILNIDEKLKKEFTQLANDFGTNPTNLAKMLIKNVVNTKKMYFEVKEVPDLLEFEPYTDEEYKDLLNNKNIKKNIKKLEKLLP